MLFGAYQYWVIPIHQGNHWSMMVLDFKSLVIQYSDSMSNTTVVEHTGLIM